MEQGRPMHRHHVEGLVEVSRDTQRKVLKARMLCRWICYLWARDGVVHLGTTRLWACEQLWSIPTWRTKAYYMLRFWLGIAYGAHRVHEIVVTFRDFMVSLEYLVHWGDEVTWCRGSLWDTLGWWSYNDSDDDALSMSWAETQLLFYTWELIWSRIMGSAWIDETWWGQLLYICCSEVCLMWRSQHHGWWYVFKDDNDFRWRRM